MNKFDSKKLTSSEDFNFFEAATNKMYPIMNENDFKNNINKSMEEFKLKHD